MWKPLERSAAKKRKRKTKSAAAATTKIGGTGKIKDATPAYQDGFSFFWGDFSSFFAFIGALICKHVWTCAIGLVGVVGSSGWCFDSWLIQVSIYLFVFIILNWNLEPVLGAIICQSLFNIETNLKCIKNPNLPFLCFGVGLSGWCLRKKNSTPPSGECTLVASHTKFSFTLMPFFRRTKQHLSFSARFFKRVSKILMKEPLKTRKKPVYFQKRA